MVILHVVDPLMDEEGKVGRYLGMKCFTEMPRPIINVEIQKGN